MAHTPSSAPGRGAGHRSAASRSGPLGFSSFPGATSARGGGGDAVGVALGCWGCRRLRDVRRLARGPRPPQEAKARAQGLPRRAESWKPRIHCAQTAPPPHTCQPQVTRGPRPAPLCLLGKAVRSPVTPNRNGREAVRAGESAGSPGGQAGPRPTVNAQEGPRCARGRGNRGTERGPTSSGGGQVSRSRGVCARQGRRASPQVLSQFNVHPRSSRMVGISSFGNF